MRVFHEVLRQLNSVVFDKSAEGRLALTCLLAQGHLLIEDVPGVGKTTMVRALGQLCGLKTNRIQFTVDLLPADILGGSIYSSHEQTFKFYPGPLFAQMVLADELNRASPRTQGALLQAMEENEVSIDGVNHPLPKPFFVIATQNPQQQAGTFALPESQIDRFLMSLELDYASQDTELKLLRGKDPKDLIQGLTAALRPEDFVESQKSIDAIGVNEAVALYVTRLLQKSRLGFSGKAQGAMPLSTRAGMAMIRAAKAWAFLEGRDYLIPEDVQSVMVSVLGHRLGGTNGVKQGREWAHALRREIEVPI